jgi:hypothetical protein
VEGARQVIEGDGLTMARCEGCGGLSLVILREGKPVAYVCPPDNVLLYLAEMLFEAIEKASKATVQ